jgi:hypothetical protein
MIPANEGNSAQSLFETLLAQQADKKLPPVAKWQPEREGRIDMRIARDGTWYHEGAPIRREAMVRLFSTILRRDGDRIFLVTPAEKLAIEVEDAPFTAILLEQDGEGEDQRLLLTTNVGDNVLIDVDHPLRVEDRDGEPAPYVEVRDGLDALINRATFYRLVDLAEPSRDDPQVLGVRSCGQFFPLGKI